MNRETSSDNIIPKNNTLKYIYLTIINNIIFFLDLLIRCAVHSGRPTRNYLDLCCSVAMFIVTY